MVAAIVNRVQRRIAGAEAVELDHQQRAAARQQIERIEKQLQRIDEKLFPEQAAHVEPSTTHHDSGAAHTGSSETGDRARDGDFPCGGAPSLAFELHRRARVAAAGESLDGRITRAVCEGGLLSYRMLASSDRYLHGAGSMI